MIRFGATSWWVVSMTTEGEYWTPTPDEKLPYCWKALDCRRIGISDIVRSVGGEASEPDEFLMGWTVPFAIYAKLLGEQGGEPLVKGNQVLSVFPALKFVLGPRNSQSGN
jgi:hypothetical protein